MDLQHAVKSTALLVSKDQQTVVFHSSFLLEFFDPSIISFALVVWRGWKLK